MSAEVRAPGGPRLVFLLGAIVAGTCLAIYTTRDPGERELRAVIRASAFMSASLFLATFTSSSLLRVWPSPASRWARANRRYLGLSFAFTHLCHGIAIATLYARADGLYEKTPLATLVGGGLGFVMVALLAATSNDASVRMFGRGWRVLHTAGVYYLWIIFAFTYAGPMTASPFHALVFAIFLGALGLRVVPVLRRTTGRGISQHAAPRGKGA